MSEWSSGPTIWNRVTGALAGARAGWGDPYRHEQASAAMNAATPEPRETYALLRGYYDMGALYAAVAYGLRQRGLWSEKRQPIRNPAGLVVEFYPATLFPGSLAAGLPLALPKEAKGGLGGAIQQVWQWSNLGEVKQGYARALALYGDQFLKVAGGGETGRVFLQRIRPDYVTDWKEDERGILTFLRVDTPTVTRAGEFWRRIWHTEVWDAAAGTLRVWEDGTQGPGWEVDQLGDATSVTEFDALGVSFIPVRHVRFQVHPDAPQVSRGCGAFERNLPDIDQACAVATRLYDLLFMFNKPTRVFFGGGRDAQGRPMGRLPMPGQSNVTEVADIIRVGDEEMYSLPGTYDVKDLVPQVQFAPHIDALKDQIDYLQTVLPEMGWWSLPSTQGVQSGESFRRRMMAAEARVIEARGNAEAGLLSATMQALTLAQAADLPGFAPEVIGTWEDGVWQQAAFVEREAIPNDPTEVVNIIKTATDAGAALEPAARFAGLSEEQAVALARADVVTGASQ